MKLLRSVRSRLLFGALLWSLGLLFFAHLLIYMLIRAHLLKLQVNLHAYIAFALAFLIIGAAIVGAGIRPLDQLRERTIRLRDGREKRIDGDYPAEVQPLVNDLNALLDQREEAVRRALAKAGDLAHGLKTPLAMLSYEADQALAAGHAEIANAIREQVEKMRRQVEVHLAQARAVGSAGARASVSTAAESIARTVRRLYAGRGIDITVEVSDTQFVRCEREDLEEMLGNLADNACKWARSHVSIHLGDGAILVDDDGPGLSPALREAVMRSGVRADEAAPGSGLGLAIVRDLATLYGGSIRLNDSPSGGVRAELRLPAA